MFADTLPFEPAEQVPPNRVKGGVCAAFEAEGGRTRLLSCRERDGYKLRLVAADACEAVVINTGGGVAGGDAVTHLFEVKEGAAVTLTSPAAEKVYRSNGPAAKVEVRLIVGKDSELLWLPQETILFAHARLTRRFEVDMAESARLAMAEIVGFGRAAMGETVRRGTWRESWRIRRGKTLVFAEEISLDGPIADLLARPAIGGGAVATGAFFYLAPDAQDRLHLARQALTQGKAHTAASAFNGMLCVRSLGPSLRVVRHDVEMAASAVLKRPLPRSWST